MIGVTIAVITVGNVLIAGIGASSSKTDTDGTPDNTTDGISAN